MRQYRGLTKDGKWVHGYYIKSGMGNHYIYIGTEGNPIWDIDGCYIKVISETVGQFIGRKDKNNKGVYEGDIMKTHTGWKTVVRWNEKELSYDGFMSIWEIIGNIHQNPKLMDSKNA